MSFDSAFTYVLLIRNVHVFCCYIISFDQVSCDDGTCIFKHDLCDGRMNCFDGSDETEKLCKDIFCPPFAFKCNYGACVGGDAKCNGIEDCFDGSDETTALCKPRLTTTSRPLSSVVPTGGCSTQDLVDKGLSVLVKVVGSLVNFGKVPSGSYVTVSCRNGAVIRGNDVLHCLEDGVWAQTFPTCSKCIRFE